MSDTPHLPPPAAPGEVSRRQLLVPGVVALLLFAGIAAVLLLAQRSGDSGAPPSPAAFATPTPGEPVVVYTVQQVANGRVILGAADGTGRVDVELPAAASVELLRRAQFTDLNPGDWVTAIGIPNQVRNFVIRELIAIPGPAEPGAAGFARTATGFRGHEAARDSNAEPVIGGVVTEVSTDRLVLDSAGTIIEITADEHGPPPLRLLEQGSLSDILAGSRIAIPALQGAPDPAAQGILVSLP